MWQDIEARIEENDREKIVPLRKALMSMLRDSGVQPGQGATKKMVAFEFGASERLIWQIEGTAQHFYLHQKWNGRIEDAGFSSKPFRYLQGMKDGGRHSALSRNWAFDTANCVQVNLETADALRRLISLLLTDDDRLNLDPIAVKRWIARLREFFPDFERFDKPDADFDLQERSYKLDIANDLRTTLEKAVSDQDFVDAIHSALSKSNFLQWRSYWPISPKGNADQERLWPALVALAKAALGSSESYPAALEVFVGIWREAVPKASSDPARQIAEFLFLHLAPDDGIYIRYSVRQDFWSEAVGSQFPDHASMAETYRAELRFMQAVRRAFEEHGLAPRDMIDVQSALWVAHNYKDEDRRSGMSPLLSRNDIEAAMDAYDAYQISGKHSDIFDNFGEPRDYWVRSTRERPNSVYPTKPIVGFVRKETDLNGGWSTKESGAASLHNSGYIITNRENTPVEPPERHAPLIRDADRIRLCALNYFIWPARERGEGRVSIRAGTLANDLLLTNRMRNVCQALSGERFQELADVPEPTQTGASDSTTTTFTFELFDSGKQSTMEADARDQSQTATNLILYGPPGTGKTYATAWESVLLCIGAEAAATMKNDRDALMAEYRRLVSTGRIEFVTFHQSFSYEDFVEGLRPTTESELADDEQVDTVISGGFSLRAHPGVFKVISERARLDAGNDFTKRLDRTRPIYRIALGKRGNEEDQIRKALDQSLIHIGWGGDIDWSDGQFDEKDEIKKEWNATKDPSATGMDPDIAMISTFRSSLQIGDYVIIPDGIERYRAFGIVTGEYEYDENPRPYHHNRSVKWIWRDDDGVERAPMYSKSFNQRTTTRLNPNLINWDALETVVLAHDADLPVAGARPHVLIIDEINRANISKVFGELITLLEVDKRLGCENEVRVRLPYSGTSFGVPSNLHIIGTMNTADRSIALLDTALRRRFSFRELMPDVAQLRSAMLAKDLDAENLDGINLCKLLNNINERIEYLFDREHQIGHAYFTGCKNRTDVEDIMRHKVIPLLAEYFYEDWAKVAAVLGDAPNSTKSHFLEAKKLPSPAPFADDELAGEKLRWSIKKIFDLSGLDV